MKKRILYALSLVLICALILALSSCELFFPDEDPTCPPHTDEDSDGTCDVCGEASDVDPTPDGLPDLSELSFESKMFCYDGAPHSLEISGILPEGVSVEYIGNGKTDVGEYEVTALFFYNGAEISTARMSASMTVTKGTYDMSGVHLLSLTKTYDGVEVVPELSGDLPAGVTVSFTVKNSAGDVVDRMLAAGVYTVYATFSSDNANYYPIDPVSATVTIVAPTVEGVEFKDLTLTYDGNPHTIVIEGNLPSGVEVRYEGGNRTAAGIYEIVAKFFIGEEELVDKRLSATLTINKATVDMSSVTATDQSAEYTGVAHTPLLSGSLPKGVEAVYVYEDSLGNTVDAIVAPGAYKVTVSFICDEDNYNTITPISFTYTVTSVEFDISNVYPASLTKVYDGVAVKPALIGVIPPEIKIEYTYTDASGCSLEELLNVGEYTVVAAFTSSDSSYDSIEPISFVYTITKATYDLSDVSFESVSKTYDGTAAEISIGRLPSGLSATFVYKKADGEAVDAMINAGSYTVTVSFTGDFDNYYPVEDRSLSVSIERATVGGISFADAVFDYDGEEKSIYVSGAPAWMQVDYSGNGISAPGKHTVTATFSENANYLPVPPMSAVIIINVDKSTSTGGIIFEEYKDGYAVSGIEGNESIVIIPETHNSKPVLSIKSFAFEGNSSLVYVYVPSSVVNIGNKAFADCESLLNVEFGDIKVIGQQAFKNTGIKEIALPESLESIGFGAFEGTKLEKITLPFVGGSRHTSSPFIGFIFGSSTYAGNATKVPETLKTVVFSNGCTFIPSRAFYGVSSLTEVVLGHTVTEIGNGAFQGCSGLRSVYIPASVKSIPANAMAENGPFFGTANDMMIVVESLSSVSGWGQHFASVAEGKTALLVYDKTYDDYVINKESYRVSDPSDATLSALFVDGSLLGGFDPSVLEYTLESSVNKPLPDISAITAVYNASLTVEPASVSNGNVARITVVSANGEKTLVYEVKFNMTGSFSASAEVVNKDGAKGTVTFVVDDGYKPTASFMKSMMEKYPKLAVSYAIKTEKFLATLSDKYTLRNGLAVSDVDNDGILEYLFDENGNYIYERNEEEIDFWRDILSVGRSEIVSHSHTHAFWGVNDEGGAQYTAFAERIYSTLVEGSAKKEVYASIQIVKDIFGDTSKGITYVNAGIAPKEGDVTVTEEVKVYLSAQTVRVLNDTKITVSDGKIYLSELTWVDLQSTVGTLPANTDIETTADLSSGFIPAGTAIMLPGDYVTVPTLDNNGNPNVVKGFKAYIEEIYAQAYEESIIYGGRTSGQKVYVASDFLNDTNRIYRKAYIIATSDNDPAMRDSWKNHIDKAMSVNGGWASFCIHAMTEDIAETGQGGHKITWEQAENLFSYAVEQGDDLWIATQTDAMLYYHEWSTSAVSSSYDADKQAISVSLTDKENDEIYNMALTVKVVIPGNWATATVNGEQLTIRTDESGTSFVYVDVMPETTVTVIGR